MFMKQIVNGELLGVVSPVSVSNVEQTTSFKQNKSDRNDSSFAKPLLLVENACAKRSYWLALQKVFQKTHAS